MDEAVVFALSVLIAVALIAYVAHYVLPAFSDAAAKAAEYAALRDAAPVLILAANNKTVHVCLNSTAPLGVKVNKTGVWRDADRDCRINPAGHCVPGRGHGLEKWPLCRWYLGRYKPGDAVEYIARGERVSVYKRYVVAVLTPVR